MLGQNDHLYEYWWQGSWHLNDLTSKCPLPNGASTQGAPNGYTYTLHYPYGGVMHHSVYIRTSLGTLYEYLWTPNTTPDWQCFNHGAPGGGSGALASTPSGVPVTARPTIFVHGFNSNTPQAIPGGCSGVSTWGTAEQFLRGKGWVGPFITVGYYSADALCDVDLRSYANNCPNANLNPSNIGTYNEPIDHIACELAWYINGTWSDQRLNVVAHSMGGLIVRWMLYYLAIGGSDMPSAQTVQVDQVVTMASPHGGIPASDVGSVFVCSGCLQAQQIDNGGLFMTALATPAGNSPQGMGGTDWSIMGSACDTVMFRFGGTTPVRMDGGHKYWYQSGSGCVDHGVFLTDNWPTWDTHVYYCHECPSDPSPVGDWPNDPLYPHSLALMYQALISNSW